MKFWKNITGCLISDPGFGLGDLRSWDKQEGEYIQEKKSMRCYIRVEVNLYEFLFILFHLCSSFLYNEYTNTNKNCQIFGIYHTRARISRGIGHKDCSQKGKSSHMYGRGRCF